MPKKALAIVYGTHLQQRFISKFKKIVSFVFSFKTFATRVAFSLLQYCPIVVGGGGGGGGKLFFIYL